MTGVNFDTSQVDRLALDLEEAPKRLQLGAKRVMRRGAAKVRDVMKSDATGHRHLPHLQDYVGYDQIGEYGYRIGFAKGGQGSLANIAAFGSVNNAPVMDLNHGLHVVAPWIADQMGGAAEDAVLGGAE
ncbi:MAG TPA: hypothetical protein VFH56_10940 [Acidimicrobiales bacterium]|nr:hypothetical protein [Acidimicrobiales bacterium]